MATSLSELQHLLKTFFGPSNKAKILEVVTDADNDGKELRAMLQRNRKPIGLYRRIQEKIKRIISKL